MYKACAYVLSKNFGSTYRLHCFGAVPKVKAYELIQGSCVLYCSCPNRIKSTYRVLYNEFI